MKKIFSVLFTILLLTSAAFSEEDLFSFSAGISSGIPVYGSKPFTESTYSINDKHRIILGTLFHINLNPLKQISFFTGTDILSDFNFNFDSEHANSFHFAFPIGVKIYPNLKGFNFGIAYELGFRVDDIKTDLSGKDSYIAAWSNGFRLLAEYNFAHVGKSKYYPSIGLSWDWMPRGNYTHDNIITFYIAENF